MPLEYLIRESIQSLKDNPLRSALSIIGVIFGVASVVAMLGIGMGTEAEIERLLGSLGTRNIHVAASDLTDSQWQSLVHSTLGLSFKDEALIHDLYPDIAIARLAVWRTERGDMPIFGPSYKIYGTSANLRKVLGFSMIAGRFFSELEEHLGVPVVVVPEKWAKIQFGSPAAAVGGLSQIGDAWFRIIGVFAAATSVDTGRGKGEKANPSQGDGEKTASDRENVISGLDLGGSLLVPFGAARRRLGPLGPVAPINRYILHLTDDQDPVLLARQLDHAFTRLHRGSKVINVVSAQEVIEKKKATSRLFSYFLLVIAFIAIVVGAIGIANVMLASMVERIHEVGLRRAIGAKKRDIFTQFLAESLLICLVGGAIGALAGTGVSFVIGLIMGWTIAVPWWSMLVALLIAALVGVAAGLYPAVVAARVSPIEALQGRRGAG